MSNDDPNPSRNGHSAAASLSFTALNQTAEHTLEDPLLEDDLNASLLSPSTNQLQNGDTVVPPPPLLWRRDSRYAARQLARRMGDYLAYVTLFTMLVLIPLVLYRALMDRKLDVAAFHSAEVMVCGTLILSFRLVYLHLTHWYMPEVQKYVVRILWMVPIYAIQSWLSLRFHQARIYIDTIRDFYEAYVIASFVYYLIELLGGQEALVRILQQKRATEPQLGQHAYPLSLILESWELGSEFLLQCKHGVLQYVIFQSVQAVLTFFFEALGIYGEGTFRWTVAYPYMCFFKNLSVMYALYSLVMLYSAINEELRYPVNWHPLGKFLCIKGVVFFTWWQGVIIFYLEAHGIIEALGGWSSEDVANGLIDYCIVIEMIGFAIAHSYTFTYKEYLPGHIPADLGEDEQEASRDDNNNSDESNESSRRRAATYRPPATLNQPMKFKDAFWSSTLPKETIQDIQRLRTGVDSALQQAMSPGSISLKRMTSTDEKNSETDPPEQTFV